MRTFILCSIVPILFIILNWPTKSEADYMKKSIENGINDIPKAIGLIFYVLIRLIKFLLLGK